MSKKASVTIRYQYEKCPRGIHGSIDQFAESAYRLVQNMPLAVPTLPFGTSARVSGGILTAGTEEFRLQGRSSLGNEKVRLKAIESSDGILLENSYDAAGRLVETVYPDGKVVRNRYDDQGRLVRVFFGRTDRISFKYDARGRCLNASYGQKSQVIFSYEWSNHRLPRIIRFPNGWLKYKWNESGSIMSIEDDQSEVSYQRARNGPIPDIQLRVRNGHFLKFPVTSGHYTVVKEASKKGIVTILSPFGIYTVDGSGRVYSWLRWDGNYMKLVYNAEERIRQIWSCNGLTALDYTKGVQIQSLLRTDGKRYFWYGKADEGPLLVIDPGGVMLLRLDKQGRIQGMLDTWGNSMTYGYGLLSTSHVPRTISSTKWGTLNIGYGKDGCLDNVSVTGKGRISLGYGPNGELRAVTLKGDSSKHLAEVLHLTGWLYCMRSAGKEAYKGIFRWPGYFFNM